MKSRLLSLLSLVVGLGLFLYLLKQTGTAEIVARVRALGAGFLWLLVFSGLRHVVRAYAWLRCMSDDARSVGLVAVLRARLAGEAIADLTAAGPVLGEPIKIAQLRDRVGVAALASSLAVENLIYALSSGFLVLTGVLTLLLVFAVAGNLRVAGGWALAIVGLALLGLLLGLARRWRLVSWLFAQAANFIPRLARWLPRLRELESYVLDFYGRRRGDFFLVAGCDLLFHLAGVVEVYLTLHLIGIPSTFLVAFALEAVNRILNIVFAFVPAMIGVDEAGTGLLTEALRLGAGVGVTLAILRKARMLVWIVVGLSFLPGTWRKPSS
ncbi:MAG: lysylphosphatidylglycerol synthase domain-containing protein [Blastocatellia bacterium]